MTAHEMKAEAREALGQAASDDEVLLGHHFLTLDRRGMDHAQIARCLACWSACQGT